MIKGFSIFNHPFFFLFLASTRSEFVTPRSYLDRELEEVAQRHYTLKKLLVKLSFVEEMKTFMKEPHVRYGLCIKIVLVVLIYHFLDRGRAPLLFRSYVRATENSPLFPRETEEEIQTLEHFIDLLPKVQTYLKVSKIVVTLFF